MGFWWVEGGKPSVRVFNPKTIWDSTIYCYRFYRNHHSCFADGHGKWNEYLAKAAS